jgi:hypothetical protein
MQKGRKKKIIGTIWVSLSIIFFIWIWTTFQSRDLPDDTFTNSNKITVIENNDQFIFQSNGRVNKLKIIFLQGALTDPKAYAPLCRKLAESGFTCHLLKSPWRMPSCNYQRICGLFDLKQSDYVIGGHSQGGKIASQLVYENPDTFKGLFLLGTSHPRDLDLSGQNIPCVKIYAENDGLASVEEVLQNTDKLPSGSKLIMIKGGNHSQFGYLGNLLMDRPAAISLEEQQQKTIDELLYFFNEINQ